MPTEIELKEKQKALERAMREQGSLRSYVAVDKQGDPYQLREDITLPCRV